MSQPGNDDDKVIVPAERVFQRAQGCWNCKGFNQKRAVGDWTQARQRDLMTALEISVSSPRGEEDQKVLNIRRMVDKLDHAVAKHEVGVCQGGGRTAKGEEVGHFVYHNFLCDRWTGVQGASIAREGGALDKLPEELADKLDGTPEIFKP